MKQSRRSWLKRSSALGAGLLFLPSRVFGANARINVAVIGVGGRGRSAVSILNRNKRCNVAAFADVDHGRAARVYKVNRKVPVFVDFRRMLDKFNGDIDAVAISTPDHTHHYIAAWCMKMRKHVFLEKPLAHNIAEVRDLMRLERENKLACQMGNQGHSGGGILMLDAWIKAGVLGEIREIHAWVNSSCSTDDKRPPAEPVIEGLDWDMWLGPARKVPFNKRYIRSSWRAWFEFGTGSLGDWFCHNADAPYCALGLDRPKLVEVESTGAKKLSFPNSAHLTFTFAQPKGGDVKLHWYYGKHFRVPCPAGLNPESEQIKADYGGTLIVGSKATAITGSHAGTPLIVPFTKHREMQSTLPVPQLKHSSHWDNWLNAIEGTEKSRSNFAYSARLTEAMHYGNIAMHIDRSVRVDPVKGEIVGDQDAARMMAWPPPRTQWRI